MKTIKVKDYAGVPYNYTGIVKYHDGSIEYYLNGELHRENGPAIIYPNGSIYYYLNGKSHREDGPAAIWNDGTIFYYLNNNDITEEVEEWIKENNIPKVWDNSHKILFKLTFG